MRNDVTYSWQFFTSYIVTLNVQYMNNTPVRTQRYEL